MPNDLVELGLHRIPLPDGASLEQHERRNRWMLSRALHSETTVAVVGSGLSIALGYPSWTEFVQEIVTRASVDLREKDNADQREEVNRLDRFRRTLESGARCSPDELTFFLGAAVDMLGRAERVEAVYHHYLQERFGPTRTQRLEHLDPYARLVDLPIQRFVTTNYDCELERALSSPDPFDPASLDAKPQSPPEQPLPAFYSFCQMPEDYRALAYFAVCRGDHEPSTVFHCHGLYKRPETILATEADYQAWYLGQEPQYRAFRQTMELLFTSNPILFVGYGLREPDLLRPLREYVQAHRLQKHAKPCFALLPFSDDDRDRNIAEILYEKYGLHVIPYPRREDPEEQTSEFHAAMRRLKKDAEDWGRGRLEKPIIRSIQVNAHPPDPYVHHKVGADTPILGDERNDRQLQDLTAAARGQARVVVVLGPGGTGKSFTAHKFMAHMQDEQDLFDGFFFWSSYYSDDAITGIDRLLAYLDPNDEIHGGRFKRLRECLALGRYLIVFDGFERLLYYDEEDKPEVGRSSAASIRQFLRTIKHAEHSSTVLLTTRLWPEDLGPIGGDSDPRIELIRLPLMRTEDIEGVEPFSSHARSDVSALCSLLKGHTYGLVLARRYLETVESEGPAERMRRLRATLAARNPDQRVTEMIKTTVEDLRATCGDILQQLLERISLFMSPIPESMMRSCYETAKKASAKRGEGDPPDLERLKEILLHRHLLFQVRPGSGDPERSAYTVHPTVRGFIFHKIHRAKTEDLPNFTLPGFTSGTGDIDPGEAGELVMEAIGGFKTDIDRAVAEGRWRDATELCRSTFGVLRSRMEAITVPRWRTNYDEYVRPGFQLLNLIRRISPDTWAQAAPHDHHYVSHAEGILYADELAWLYNDLGLSCCCEGHIPDTYDLWEQGYEINQVIEPDEGGKEYQKQWRQYVVQSLLHLGHLFIEVGDLKSAEEYLSRTAAENVRLGDPDYAARVIGYRGLVAHLKDDRTQAKRLYEDAIKLLEKQNRNPRARSFFLIHQANLMIDMEDYTSAEEYLRTSQSLADGRNYPDLVEYARCCRGYLHRANKKFVEARLELRTALDGANRMGIDRLVVDIKSQLARLALALEDHGEAHRLAIESLALANALGLGLRQSRGLLVLGLATTALGQRDLGIHYLEHAARLAQKQQCTSRKNEAEHALRQLAHRTDAASPTRPVIR